MPKKAHLMMKERVTACPTAAVKDLMDWGKGTVVKGLLKQFCISSYLRLGEFDGEKLGTADGVGDGSVDVEGL